VAIAFGLESIGALSDLRVLVGALVGGAVTTRLTIFLILSSVVAALWVSA